LNASSRPDNDARDLMALLVALTMDATVSESAEKSNCRRLCNSSEMWDTNSFLNPSLSNLCGFTSMPPRTVFSIWRIPGDTKAGDRKYLPR
jgi:hypothetical protein